MTQLVSSCSQHTQQKLLRTLEECKQIPKDDRLIIRKMVFEGNKQMIQILEDHRNKKIQIKLRKCLQRQKENTKIKQAQRNGIQIQERLKSRDEKSGRIQNMMRGLRQFQKSLDIKKSKTQANSLKNSKIYQRKDCPLKAQQNNIFGSKYSSNIYTQLQTQYQDNLFTSPSFLQQIRNPIMNTNKIVINSSLTQTLPNFNSFQKYSSLLNLHPVPCEQSKEQLLKNTLIAYYAQDIFMYICNKHFPISMTCQSVYVPYRKLLEQIQGYVKTSSLKNNQSTIKSQECSQKCFIGQNQIKIPILLPFDSEYQAVTIEKLGEFLNRYCLKRSNQIHNIFIILGTDDEFNKNYTISQERFSQINQWRGNQLVKDFKDIVERWGSKGSISYWRIFRVQSEIKVRQFLQKYHRKA